jgi:hypothetical protein
MNDSMLTVSCRCGTAVRGAEDDRSHSLGAARTHGGAIRRVARLAEKRRNDPVGAAALLRQRDNGGESILERQLVRGIPGEPVVETKVSRDSGHQGIGSERQPAIGAKRTGIAAAEQIHHESGVLSGTSDRVVGSEMLCRDSCPGGDK